MLIRISSLIFVGTILFLGSIGLTANNEILLGGVSKIDITPRESVALAGYPSSRFSNGIHDNLYCRVAAFKMSENRLIFISCDLIGFDTAVFEICKTIFYEKFGLKPEEIILAGTHTHSAPVLTLNPKDKDTSNYRYTQELQNKLVLAVEKALSDLEPVDIGIGSGYCPIGINRRVLELAPNRWPHDGGLIKEGRNPKGIVDHEVLVLKVLNHKNETKCCLFNYGCHNRSLNSQNQVVSGDFFGLAEQFIEKNLENNAVVLGFSGTGGDVDPYYVKNGFGTGPGGISETELMGTILGVEVLNVSGQIYSLRNLTLNHNLETIKLPAKVQNEYITDPDLPQRDLNITIFSIGDIAFIGLGCEAFTDIGLKIKEASPFKYNFMITICNGSSGYLAPKDLYKERGYGVSNSRFGPEAAEMVVKKVLNILYKQNVVSRG